MRKIYQCALSAHHFLYHGFFKVCTIVSMETMFLPAPFYERVLENGSFDIYTSDHRSDVHCFFIIYFMLSEVRNSVPRGLSFGAKGVVFPPSDLRISRVTGPGRGAYRTSYACSRELD